MSDGIEALDELRQAVEQAERSERLKQAADFRWLMNDERGRRFMWRLMGHCKVFEPSFNPHGGIMNFNEGQRNVGLFLLGEVNQLCPALFPVMAAENAPKPVEDEIN
ncbi:MULTISPECIES: Bbp19 family protein [Pseudomonas]|uniref:Bbp19 family protein n=1 Tax=Pseudomonas TaxID=286 RepID=UPI001BEBD40D|nr:MULTISPECIES: hypothetical protein [Pseudomonas]MBT2339526.1 hypothetical protein [Pseudomonas fluorescens]MCD4528690.1 hypothetical protein [Pseudomonas sp. C3-2018]